MAIGKGSDFKIRDEFFELGVFEKVAQAIEGVSEGSRGGILLSSERHKGDYSYEDYFSEISSAVTRRDLTSVSAATDLAMTQDEFIGVKINRKVGPIAQTLNSFRKKNLDPESMSFLLGQKHAEWKLQDMLNTGLVAVETALDGQTTNEFDGSGSGITHGKLNSALAKLQDRSGRVVSWVMHGVPAHDLIGQAITDKVTDVANVAIAQGSTFGLGRPIVVTDAAALTDANGSLTDTYNTLGLVVGGLRIEESEQEDVAFELVTGLEQLVFRYQAEYAFTIFVKGFKWDVSNGGANPTDATLGTTTNWDLSATSFKDLAGVRLVTD